MVDFAEIQRKLDDPEWLRGPGLYWRRESDVIRPKPMDTWARVADAFDVDDQIAPMIDAFERRSPNSSVVHGHVFTVVFPALIPVPPFFQTDRLVRESNTVLTCLFMPATGYIGGENLAEGIGFTILLVGIFKTAEFELPEPSQSVMIMLDYVNQLIASYRLVRDDRTVFPMAVGWMQSDVPSYFVERGDRRMTRVTPIDPIRVNSNDVDDLLAKTLFSEQDLQAFSEYAEILPNNARVARLASLMIGCIDSVCRHEYEDAILRSDRFAELSLRYLAERMGLPAEVSGNEVLYAYSDGCRSGLVHDLAEHLGLDDHRIRKWLTDTRSAKNSIACGVGAEGLAHEHAWRAVKANLELIELAIAKANEPSGDLEVLGIGAVRYRAMFVEPAGSRSKGRK